jgi:hypothetical protein
MDKDTVITANFAYVVNEQYGVYLYEDLDGLSPNNPYQTPYFVHGPNLGDYPVLRVVGTDTEKPIGGGITLSNVVIDDDWYGTQNSWDQIFGIRGYPAYFSAAIVAGNGNSMKYVTLRNCRRYGLDSFNARNFYIGYCKVEAGQHCLTAARSDTGIIEHNHIRGIWIDGIKVVGMKNCDIRYNYIDFSPYELHPNYLTSGVVGCDFNSDSPNDNRNVTFHDNEYVRWLGDGRTTYAFTVEGSGQGVPDVNGDLGTPGIPNLKFINNRITSMAGTTYSAYIYGNYIEVTGNTFINTRDIFESPDAYGNIISPNTFLNGPYNFPTPPVAGAQIPDCSSGG